MEEKLNPETLTPETLQANILEALNKAKEIGKALDYLLTCPPEGVSFDPDYLVQSMIDYLNQIEDMITACKK